MESRPQTRDKPQKKQSSIGATAAAGKAGWIPKFGRLTSEAWTPEPGNGEKAQRGRFSSRRETSRASSPPPLADRLTRGERSHPPPMPPPRHILLIPIMHTPQATHPCPLIKELTYPYPPIPPRLSVPPDPPPIDLIPSTPTCDDTSPTPSNLDISISPSLLGGMLTIYWHDDRQVIINGRSRRRKPR